MSVIIGGIGMVAGLVIVAESVSYLAAIGVALAIIGNTLLEEK